jgi:hypothetical protein
MRGLYKMSPRWNDGRFAMPKQNPRGVYQIAPEQPLVGADDGQSGDRRISIEKRACVELQLINKDTRLL